MHVEVAESSAAGKQEQELTNIPIQVAAPPKQRNSQPKKSEHSFSIKKIKVFQRKPLRYVRKAVDIGSTDTLDSKVQDPLPIETAEELNFNSYQSKLTSLNQEKSTAPPATQEMGTQQQEYSIVMDHDVPSMLDSYHAVKSQEKIRSLYSYPFNLVEWGREMRRQKELQGARSQQRNANFMVTGLNLKSKLQTLSAGKEPKSAK